MLKGILNWLRKAWDFIKKAFVRLFDFAKNLLSHFKKWIGIIKKKNPNALAVAIKIENTLKKGDFNQVSIGDLDNKNAIVKTFYDQHTGEIINEATEVIEYENLDKATKQSFGDKEMIIINE